MNEPEFNFENDISIDLDNLHEEWRTHAQMRYKYASHVSYLDKVLRKIGEEIATVKAKLIKKCKTENAKATVQQIDASCIENENHIAVRNRQIEAEYELSMIKNALRAFDDRKSALENEVKLWAANYFSSPTEEKNNEDNNSKDVAAKGREEVTTNARATMNKKKRTRK